jgi:hypothetical protein
MTIRDVHPRYIVNPDGTAVDADNPLPVALSDGSGNPLSSYLNPATGDYVLNIHDADVHSSIINVYLHQHTATTTTVATATTGDGSEYTLDIADATGFANLDYIHINTTSIETTHPRIISASPALPTTGPVTLTLDRRLDKVHSIGDSVIKVTIDMASQVGTMASPQEYFAGPENGAVWHLTRILFAMELSTAGDLGLFGNIAKLTNGVLLRARINNQYYTLTNWKDNAGFKVDMFDVEFDLRSGGGGTHGLSGRGTFKQAGSIVRLDSATNDRLELYVQDDITAINSFTMKSQGHLESG